MSNIQTWRNSFTLVPDASAPGQCKKGQTFRSTARHSSVEFGESKSNCGSIQNGGTAKPGPTTQFDSSLVRKRRIQVRTKSNKIGNSASFDKFERTFRGYNSHVENGRDGYGIKMSLSVTSNQATSNISAIMTLPSAPTVSFVVGDKVIVTGHTGNSANLAMNQTFTVASVTNTTTVVLTGSGMTSGTYNTGTIVADVVRLPRAQLFGHENNTVPQSGVRGDASDVIYFRPIFEKFKLDVTSK
jgi:hypothetical protein